MVKIQLDTGVRLYGRIKKAPVQNTEASEA